MLAALRLGAVVSITVVAAVAAGDASDAAERRIRYAVTVYNRIAEPLQGVEVEVEAPIRRTAQQEVIDLEASLPFDEVHDRDGNTSLRFRIDLGPHARRTIVLTAGLRFAAIPRGESLPESSRFTRAERFLEVEDPQIREAAIALGGERPGEIARAALDWVHAHVRMEGYVAEDRGARVALESGVGDCTESADLFVALLRARGVPARAVEGYVVAGDAVLRAADYHGWAEFYAGGRWHAADPQRRVLDPDAGTYIVTRRLGEVQASDAARRRRFTANHPALVVRPE